MEDGISDNNPATEKMSTDLIISKDTYMKVHLWMEVGLSRLAISTVVRQNTALVTVGLAMFAKSKMPDKPTLALQPVGQKGMDMLNNEQHGRSH